MAEVIRIPATLANLYSGINSSLGVKSSNIFLSFNLLFFISRECYFFILEYNYVPKVQVIQIFPRRKLAKNTSGNNVESRQFLYAELSVKSGS